METTVAPPLLGLLASGEEVYDRATSHVAGHPDALPLLLTAFARIHAEGRDIVEAQVCFGRVIGSSICVETTPNDDIVFAQRTNRRGLTRFVKNREARPTDTLTVILRKEAEKSSYILITAYVGLAAPYEPWDRFATADSLPFWNSHALIWGAAEIVPGTETTQCPW